MTSCVPLAVALAAMVAMPTAAQMAVAYPAGSGDPAAQLSANLVILSQNPRDVNALIGAGQSAIAVGDGNAALSFLARAEEISPRNGRIKAALGSALLLLERPGEALKLFSEASELGVPDADIAADRGLAHDLRGESRKAQRDYLLAQRVAPSDEITRRLALSYGISGDRSAALSLLDPLLRKQDAAAWRARAFILAMTGDLPEAEDIASTVMPQGMGNGMRPFLRRLAMLGPADRAMAVNFGTMPGDGTRLAANDSARSISGGVGGALIPAGDLAQPRAEDRAPAATSVAVTRDPRRRPGASDPAGVRPGFTPDKPAERVAALSTPAPAAAPGPGRIERRIEKRLAPVDPTRLPPEVRTALAPDASASKTKPSVAGPAQPAPAPVAGMLAAATSVGPPPAIGGASAAAEPLFEVPAPSAAGSSVAPPAAAVADAKPVPTTTSGSTPSSVVVAVVPQQPVASPVSAPIASPDPGTVAVASFAPPVATPPAGTLAPTPVPSVQPRGLADIIATIEPEPESAAAPLPTDAELRAARLAQQRKAAAQAKLEAQAKAEKDAKEAARREAAKHPARVWVQVATGANEAGLPSTWKRIREKSPDLFKGLGAASVPFKATNRLLVGPLKSQAEARALVNALQKAGMSSTTYASEAGQEVARIALK